MLVNLNINFIELYFAKYKYFEKVLERGFTLEAINKSFTIVKYSQSMFQLIIITFYYSLSGKIRYD